MQHQKTWKITEIRDGEEHVVMTGASHTEAVQAIRAAMYGEGESLLAPAETSVHELPLAA
jgi:hypothetical protein